MFLPTRPGVARTKGGAAARFGSTVRSGRVLAPSRGLTTTTHERPGRRRPVRSEGVGRRGRRWPTRHRRKWEVEEVVLLHVRASYVDAEAVAKVARHVPLPFERLWLVAVQVIRRRVAVVDAFGGAAPFLRKERKAREMWESRAFTIKATAHDDRRAYEKAKRIALKAREARREARIALADHGPEHPLDNRGAAPARSGEARVVETGSLRRTRGPRTSGARGGPSA